MHKLRKLINVMFFSSAIMIVSVDAMSAHPITAIGSGPLFQNNLNSTQNFPIQDPNQDEFYSYHTNTASRTVGFFDLFLGVEQPLILQPLALDLFFQYGINYHQPSVLTINGVFTQGLDAQSSNLYQFRYQTIPHQLLAQAKLLYKLNYNLYPYVFGGLGASFNSASQYSTNTPPFITFTRQYKNHTLNSFSYAAGLGIDWEAKPGWRLGAAWRFNDFGTTQLNSATINNIPVNGTLTLNNIYANEILFQLTKVW
jgi:hypothetical protein